MSDGSSLTLVRAGPCWFTELAMHTATNTKLSILFRLGGWRACVVRAASIERADSLEEILPVIADVEDRLKDEVNYSSRCP